MLTRLSKIALIAAVGLFLAIVVLNNLTDYKSNYDFVFHVLSMDTTFPGNALMWRAIHSEPVYHAFYASLILWEAAAAVLMFVGAWKLWQARGAGGDAVLRVAGGLVVDPAADQAHPSSGFAHVGFTRWSLQWIEIVATGVAPGSVDRHPQGRLD